MQKYQVVSKWDGKNALQILELSTLQQPVDWGFHNERKFVSSSQLCEVIEPLVKKMYETEQTQAQKQGQEAHDSMLSR